MPLPFNVLMRAIMAGGGAVGPSFNSPTIIAVGDSITNFGNFGAVVTGTLTRTSNIVAATATGNGMNGNPNVYISNVGDASFVGIGRNTYAANSIAVNIPGADGTTTGDVNSRVVNMDRHDFRGIIPSLQARFGGGLELRGALGNGGWRADRMGPQMAYAIAQAPNIILLMAGTNDIKSAASAATTYTRVRALMDQAIAGNVFCVVCGIIPLGSVNGGYAALNASIQTVNASIQAYCAANPSKLLFADTFTPLYDGANTCLYASMTIDGTHPLSNASFLMGDAVYSALSPKVTVPVMLPTSAADTGTVNGHTKLVLRGPWISTTGGNFGTRASGTLPPGWTAQCTAGTANTAVCSIVDPGDGKGFKVAATCTSTAASNVETFWPWSSSPPSLATLGVSVGDEIAVACEMDWAGAAAAKVSLIKLFMMANSGGGEGIVSMGETAETTGAFPDAATSRTFITGWLKVTAATTFLNPQISVTHYGAGSAFTLNVRRVVLLKK